MSNLIDLFIRFKNTLLFIFLLTIALILSVQAHSYQKSKVISSANAVSGGLYSWVNNIDEYFALKSDNVRLVEENRTLRQQLYNRENHVIDSSFTDTTNYGASYKVYKADVIANHFSKLDNYILIDKGANDSIKPEMGVITSKGIVGVVENTSTHYARVISVLNTNLAINAQLKNSEHFGTLKWDGKNPNIVLLNDVPKLATVHKGDTIMTNGRSLIFPKGIPIGTVQDFTMVNGDNYYQIEVKLFNDMTNIGNVYIIKNNSRQEIESLYPEHEE